LVSGDADCRWSPRGSRTRTRKRAAGKSAQRKLAALAFFRGAGSPTLPPGRKASPRESGVSYISTSRDFSNSIRPSSRGRTTFAVSTTVAGPSARFKLSASTESEQVAKLDDLRVSACPANLDYGKTIAGFRSRGFAARTRGSRPPLNFTVSVRTSAEPSPLCECNSCAGKRTP